MSMFYAFLPGKDYCPAHASLDKDCAPPPGHRLSIQVKKKGMSIRNHTQGLKVGPSIKVKICGYEKGKDWKQ